MHKHEEAIKVYEEALHLEETPALVYFKMGLCYNKIGQPLKALRFFQHVFSKILFHPFQQGLDDFIMAPQSCL